MTDPGSRALQKIADIADSTLNSETLDRQGALERIARIAHDTLSATPIDPASLDLFTVVRATIGGRPNVVAAKVDVSDRLMWVLLEPRDGYAANHHLSDVEVLYTDLTEAAGQRDNEPCQACGGDRLRLDFTGSGRCHAARSADLETITLPTGNTP